MASILELLADDQAKDPKIADTLSKLVEVRRGLDLCFNGPNVTDADRALGFVLLLFPFGGEVIGDPGACTYLANINDKERLIAALRYQADMLEMQPAEAENWPLNRRNN